jgi:2-aminoadipate transaminase
VETISFARGIPAPECLPVEELADCARAAIERDGRTVLSYGAGGGYAPLRAWLAERHGVDPERVLVTNGSLQGFVFLANRFAGERRFLVEAPTYDRPLKILRELGAEVVAIPQDDDGLDVDALEEELDRGPALLYTIPTFQNPSGRTLSTKRRRRVAELAAGHDLLVYEDDPYGLVRFEGEAQPSLLELAGERVLYSSSFSKTVAPGVRVGYFVLPGVLAAELEARAVSTYITPALLGEATVYEFLRRGAFEPNLERVRGLLRERRDAMLAALEAELGGRASWSRPEGGYFLWLDLGVDSAELLGRAERAGVTFIKGADFYPPGEGGERSARLAFSFVSPAEIAEGVGRLAALVPAAAKALS